MSRPEGSPDPFTVFNAEVANRRQQVDRLAVGLRRGIDLVTNRGLVNEKLAHSARPDLVITEPVQVSPLRSYRDVASLNNFVPRFMAFGVPLFEDKQDPWDRTLVIPHVVGYRDFTAEERAQALFIGARGKSEQHIAFAEAHGVDGTFAQTLYLNTHIRHQSFMRMWLLLPDLTEELLTACLDRQWKRDYRRVEEELYVGYSLMASLVDRKDTGVLSEDGTVNTGVFRH